MIRRLALAMIAGAVWSVPAALLLGLTLGWILLGAAVIGILATIGVEPPRRIRRAVLALARSRA
jgi:hypothetical protein